MARAANSPAPGARAAAAPPRLPAFVLGLGFGGFIDGIVLHQLLQWHHLLTGSDSHPMTTVAGLETNTLADGFSTLGRGC
jgi:uncharacterized membrane protein